MIMTGLCRENLQRWIRDLNKKVNVHRKSKAVDAEKREIFLVLSVAYSSVNSSFMLNGYHVESRPGAWRLGNTANRIRCLNLTMKNRVSV